MSNKRAGVRDVYLTEDVRRAIVAYADASNQSMSEVIRAAMVKYNKRTKKAEREEPSRVTYWAPVGFDATAKAFSRRTLSHGITASTAIRDTLKKELEPYL